MLQLYLTQAHVQLGFHNITFYFLCLYRLDIVVMFNCCKKNCHSKFVFILANKSFLILMPEQRLWPYIVCGQCHETISIYGVNVITAINFYEVLI